MYSSLLLLLPLPIFALAHHPKGIGLGKPLWMRDIAAAAATTTVIKTVTSISTLTTCPGTSSTSTRTTSASATTSMPTDENGAIKKGDSWVLPGVGTFQKKATYTFTGNSLPTGLQVSDYFVQDTSADMTNQIPYNHRFDPVNVAVSNGALRLKVPGSQRVRGPSPDDDEGTPISCAEIVTSECKIKYASVRTRAMFSRVPGTCQGLFYYKNDKQECDIEFLSDPKSESNDGEHYPIPIWYSNQANTTGKEPTHVSLVAPGDPMVDPTADFHEHRIDWTPNYTEFFFDGHSRAKFTENVPQQPGSWVWNNWANGDKGRSRLGSVPLFSAN